MKKNMESKNSNETLVRTIKSPVFNIAKKAFPISTFAENLDRVHWIV
jgi:hypothetical protein